MVLSERKGSLTFAIWPPWPKTVNLQEWSCELLGYSDAALEPTWGLIALSATIERKDFDRLGLTQPV